MRESREKRKRRRKGGFDLTKRHMPHLYSADDLTRGSHLQLERAGCLRLAPRKSGSTTAATEWRGQHRASMAFQSFGSGAHLTLACARVVQRDTRQTPRVTEPGIRVFWLPFW